MTALIAILGGVRAAIFAGLALVLSVAFGLAQWRLSSTKLEFSQYREKMVELTADARVKTEVAAKAAKLAREKYDELHDLAESSFQAGRQSAEQAQASVVADLRSDRIRLRNEWAACMSRPAQDAGTSGAAGGSDGATPVPAEAFGRVLRVGDDADNQVRWLQSELIATRELAKTCGTQ